MLVEHCFCMAERSDRHRYPPPQTKGEIMSVLTTIIMFVLFIGMIFGISERYHLSVKEFEKGMSEKEINAIDIKQKMFWFAYYKERQDFGLDKGMGFVPSV